MQLSSEEVKCIARLARLALSDAEAGAMRAQLDSIFGLIEQMQAVDTNGIEPMAHAQELVQRLREDVVTEADRHEQLQRGAPAVENGLYLVPKVIE
jgi:aspartyl-tRNA(Asn)/glutamyl-tRNA(Gln) amidotransferase subunit C